MKTLTLIAAVFAWGACEQPTLSSLLKNPTACFDNVNCPPGSQCINGTCQFGVSCSNDLDCGAGRRCVSGTCR